MIYGQQIFHCALCRPGDKCPVRLFQILVFLQSLPQAVVDKSIPLQYLQQNIQHDFSGLCGFFGRLFSSLFGCFSHRFSALQTKSPAGEAVKETLPPPPHKSGPRLPKPFWCSLLHPPVIYRSLQEASPLCQMR